MKKILFFNKKNDFLNCFEININGYEIIQEDVYRNDLPIIFVKIFRRLSVLSVGLSLGKWKKIDNLFDFAIIMDSEALLTTLYYLIKRPIAHKQILCFINRVSKNDEKKIEYAKNNGFTIFSYNVSDCKKYQLKYCGQCWNSSWLQRINFRQTLTQDVYFMGLAKDRFEIVKKIKEELEKHNITVKTQIISQNNEIMTQRERIPYKIYLEEVTASRAILDVVSEKNYGLTLRPLEALFLRKKVITNYMDIVEYDFYNANKKNIFIFGIDDISLIYEFIHKPFYDNDYKLDKYNFSSWIKNICEND